LFRQHIGTSSLFFFAFLEILTEHKLKLVTLRSLVDVVDKDLADSRRSIPV